MLKLDNITKRIANHYRPILSDINLELEPGDFCIVIGSNGSGKSSLFKAISGEYSTSSGQVLIENRKISRDALSRSIYTVTQDINKGTVSEMSLLENIALCYIKNNSAKLKTYSRYKDKIIKILTDLNIGLEKHIDKAMHTLSGGQRQVVATVMAIVSNPKILLLDEHTSALDPKRQNFVMEYTSSSIKKLGLTALMVTHNLDDAIKYGNRIIMLHEGEIVLSFNQQEKTKMTKKDLINYYHKYEDISFSAGAV